MTKTFTKGQTVHLIGRWDHKGTAYVRRCIVHSAGKKRMVLHDAVTGTFIGSDFVPQERQRMYSPNYNGSDFTMQWVRAGLTDEQAVEAALDLARKSIGYEINHYASRIEGGGSEFYLKSMRADLAEVVNAKPAHIDLTGRR